MDKVKELMLEVLEKGDSIIGDGIAKGVTFIKISKKYVDVIVVKDKNIKDKYEFCFIDWEKTAISKIIDLWNSGKITIKFKDKCDLKYDKNYFIKEKNGYLNISNGVYETDFTADIEKTLSKYIEKVKQKDVLKQIGKPINASFECTPTSYLHIGLVSATEAATTLSNAMRKVVEIDYQQEGDYIRSFVTAELTNEFGHVTESEANMKQVTIVNNDYSVLVGIEGIDKNGKAYKIIEACKNGIYYFISRKQFDKDEKISLAKTDKESFINSTKDYLNIQLVFEDVQVIDTAEELIKWCRENNITLKLFQHYEAQFEVICITENGEEVNKITRTMEIETLEQEYNVKLSDELRKLLGE